MSGSKQVKREFAFLWRIIAAFFLVLGINSIVKNIMEFELAVKVSFLLMGILLLVVSSVYYMQLKPVFNQLVVFIISLGISLGSTVFYVFDLKNKNIMGALCIPLFLIFCGMWIYSKHAKEEIK